MRIFVTGGAGYIGSHTAHMLDQAKHEVTVYDNLSSGNLKALPARVKFVEGDITDKKKLSAAITSEKPEALIHFAAKIEVEESLSLPLKYYENNFYGTLCVLEACEKSRVSQFVFSSTAAVYGDAKGSFLTESAITDPINPYGTSKLMSEKLIQDFSVSNNWFRFVILRYFNPAGAQVDSETKATTLKNGSYREKATHLITLAARAAAGVIDDIKIFGNDYSTPDGTCIRDYIHIDDLAGVHTHAVDYLSSGHKSNIFNCGYGHGTSVAEVIQVMKEVTGVDFKVEVVDRRPGDVPSLIANSEKARGQLSWNPKLDDIRVICRSAYEWELFRKKSSRT